MTQAFTGFDQLHDTAALSSDEPIAKRLRRYIADLVEFTGREPDLLRIMIQEAGQITPRMTWLASTRTQPMFNEFCALVREGQQAGIVCDTPPSRLFYAAAAIASLPFSVAAEYTYLVGEDPFTKSQMDLTRALIERLVFKS